MFGLDFEKASWLACAGLLWDISGAYFLAKALVFSKDELIKRQSQTYFDMSLPLLRMQVEQRIDARFGISQIVVGFLMQLVSSAGGSANLAGALFWFFPAVFVWLQYWHNYNYWVLRDAMRIAAWDLFDVNGWVANFACSEEEVRKVFRQTLSKHTASKFEDAVVDKILTQVSRGGSLTTEELAQGVHNQSKTFIEVAGGQEILNEIAVRIPQRIQALGYDQTSRQAELADAMATALRETTRVMAPAVQARGGQVVN